MSKAWKSITNAVKKVFSNPISLTLAAIVVAPWAGLYIGSTFGLSTAAGYAISGFTAGFIASGGSLQAGAIGAVTALGFYGIGNLAQAGDWGLARTSVAHGMVGGTSNVAMGGKFKHGFLSGGFASFSSPVIGTAPGGWVGRTVAAAVVGGTAAELGGGKFANGAITGAFSRLYNHESHSDKSYDRYDLKVRLKLAGGVGGFLLNFVDSDLGKYLPDSLRQYAREISFALGVSEIGGGRLMAIAGAEIAYTGGIANVSALAGVATASGAVGLSFAAMGGYTIGGGMYRVYESVTGSSLGSDFYDWTN